MFVLSIAATLLLYRLLRRGDASRVASLLYLVPPVTALMAWAAFGETLAPLTLAGMALTAVGVALVASPPPSAPSAPPPAKGFRAG